MAIDLIVIGILISGAQWVPSKELLDRSPRARRPLVEGIDIRLMESRAVADFGGSRGVRHSASDTDWLDGFYPYHEVNAYVGLIAMVLAVVGRRRSRVARPVVELLGLVDWNWLRANAG